MCDRLFTEMCGRHTSWFYTIFTREGFCCIAIFRQVLIDGFQCLGAFGAFGDGLNPFHGVLRITGVGFDGAGTGDCGFLGAIGEAVDPLTDGFVVLFCPAAGELEGSLFRFLVRDVIFCKSVNPLAGFIHILRQTAGGKLSVIVKLSASHHGSA